MCSYLSDHEPAGTKDSNTLSLLTRSESNHFPASVSVYELSDVLLKCSETLYSRQLDLNQNDVTKCFALERLPA